MPKLPALNGKELIKILNTMGFIVMRTHGSHVRLLSDDGRVTTVPVHGTREIPKGLLRKIIRDDLDMSLEEWMKFYSEYKGK